ncbi:MAG: VWA domain-containing protein [Akkermansiaceae bacterium]
MSEIFVTETDNVQLAANALAVKRAVENQRRKESVQSAVTALLAFGVVLAVLALIALIPISAEYPQIVTYQAASEEEEPPMKMKELTNSAQPKPPGASSSMAKVIAAQITSPISVPIPEVSNPDGLFGMEEAFGPGFGTGDGDGDGGGGSTFFGSYRQGQRVVFCVDYSGSMSESTEGGSGTRIAALKTELANAIKKLPSNMSVSVIFFSTTGWTIETEGPDFFSNGWSGVGKMPPVLWYPANDRLKTEVISQIEKMPIKGGTNWYPPLKMAFSMSPAPNIVYLLSDGDPRDGESVLSDMSEINPDGIPIDTIAFELPGSAAGKLRDIAEDTGGKFVLIYKGKRLTGSSAEKYTSSDYDE